MFNYLDEYYLFDIIFLSIDQNSERHAALVSDLIEEFRAGIVDSLVLYLVNKNIINVEKDFVFRDGGCFLNDGGRKKYLQTL